MSRHLEGAPIPDEHRAEALAALEWPCGTAGAG